MLYGSQGPATTGRSTSPTTRDLQLWTDSELMAEIKEEEGGENGRLRGNKIENRRE